MGLFSQKKKTETAEAQRIERERQEAENKKQAEEEKRKQTLETIHRMLAKASTAYKNNDFESTIRILQPMVDSGIPEA